MAKDKTPQEILEMLRSASPGEVEGAEEEKGTKEKTPESSPEVEKEEGEEEEEEGGGEEEEEEDPDETYRKAIKELAGMMSQTTEGESEGEGKEEESEGEGEQPEPPKIQDVDFTSGIDIEDLDASTLNSLLNAVYKAALTQAMGSSQAVRQEMLRIVPLTTNRIVQQQMAVKTVVDDFYADNPDLKPYRELMYYVANSLNAKNPDLGLRKLFDETGKKVRAMLRMRAAGADNDDKGGKPRKKKGTGPSLGTGSPPRKPGAKGEEPEFLSEFKELMF